MADIKDKVVTVESLSALHKSNKETYMTKENPTGNGSFSMNRMSNTTIGDDSHAEGHWATASAQAAHAEGWETVASGIYSHAEGYLATSSEQASHAEGGNTNASGLFSHAEGSSTTASGYASHSEGWGTIASCESQHVQGRYNIKDTSRKYAHIVGNGSNSGGTITRSNAHTVDWDGNAWFAGNVSMDGNIVLGSHQYGNTLPAAGTVGRIFFKKLSE